MLVTTYTLLSSGTSSKWLRFVPSKHHDDNGYAKECL